MYAVAIEYTGEDDFEYEFSDEEVKSLEDRRAKRLSSESKTYNWQDAKGIITGRKN